MEHPQPPDDALHKVFRHLALEYHAKNKPVVPRWKRFARTQHESVDHIEKKRLDNAIWRAWFMYKRFKKKTPYVQFRDYSIETDAVGKVPVRAAILEGSYWDRQPKSVQDDYKRCRRWWKDRLIEHMKKNQDTKMKTSIQTFAHDMGIDLEEYSADSSAGSAAPSNFDTLGMDIDTFTDTLFSSLHEPWTSTVSNDNNLAPYQGSDVVQASLDALVMSTAPLKPFEPKEWTRVQGLIPVVNLPPQLMLGQLHRDMNLNPSATTNTNIPVTYHPPPPMSAPPVHPIMPGLSWNMPLSNSSFGVAEPSSEPTSSMKQSRNSSYENLKRLSAPSFPSEAYFDGAANDEEEYTLPPLQSVKVEKHRRMNLSDGFNMILSLVPASGPPGTLQKLSKAGTLIKASEHIQRLSTSKDAKRTTIARLRNEIALLRSTPMERSDPGEQVRSTGPTPEFEKFIENMSARDLKFWIFSKLFAHLTVSFNETVSTRSLYDMFRTLPDWVKQLGSTRENVAVALSKLIQELQQSQKLRPIDTISAAQLHAAWEQTLANLQQTSVARHLQFINSLQQTLQVLQSQL